MNRFIYHFKWSTLWLIHFIILSGCEDNTPIMSYRGTISNEIDMKPSRGFPKDMSLVEDMSQPEDSDAPEDSDLYEDMTLPDDMALSQDIALPEDITISDDMSLPADMALSQDMNLPCIEAEVRTVMPCGLEECVFGEWVAANPFEYCNQHDNDCDGVIDEPPVTRATTCCTDHRCLSRSYCERGECVSLLQGECILDGDCEEDKTCIDRQCRPIPPSEPSSCRSPITINLAGFNNVSGNSSNNEIPLSASGCNVFDTGENRLNEGYEVVYYLDYRLGRSQNYTLTATVRIGQVPVPITFSILTDCADFRTLISCHDNYHPNTSPADLRATATFRRGQEYYFVIDTIGDTLQEEMARQGVGFDQVIYGVTIDQKVQMFL